MTSNLSSVITISAVLGVKMPLVVIYGLGVYTDSGIVIKIYNEVRSSIASITDLGIQEDDIDVFFVPDTHGPGLRRKVVVEVTRILYKQGITEWHHKRIIESIEEAVRSILPDYEVKCNASKISMFSD